MCMPLASLHRPSGMQLCSRGQDELQELLTRGVAAGPMQIFLTRRPGEHGVKQVARAVDAAYDAAHTSLASSVIDALQRATFLLGELRGLLSSSPTYAALGIEVCIVRVDAQLTIIQSNIAQLAALLAVHQATTDIVIKPACAAAGHDTGGGIGGRDAGTQRGPARHTHQRGHTASRLL